MTAGTAVTPVVRSDVADEAHGHGYDRTADVSLDRPAELGFDAAIPGLFESSCTTRERSAAGTS